MAAGTADVFIDASGELLGQSPLQVIRLHSILRGLLNPGLLGKARLIRGTLGYGQPQGFVFCGCGLDVDSLRLLPDLRKRLIDELASLVYGKQV
ncbi:MAG: hypothetical protein AABM66_11960 [Actinomycetota bacterium]